MKYTAIISEIEDGWFMGQCEQVPGAITQGRSIKEVEENLKEAISLVLECERDFFRKQYEGKKYLVSEIAMA